MTKVFFDITKFQNYHRFQNACSKSLILIEFIEWVLAGLLSRPFILVLSGAISTLCVLWGSGNLKKYELIFY